MRRLFVFFTIILPLSCFAQVNISGRILNQADTKPVANASVFLSNATIGDKTAADGSFTLYNVNPGKYDLIVSILGFEAFDQTVIVGYKNISLPDITIFPKTISLSQVTIKPHDDPDRAKYYEMFKDAFIGASDLAPYCKILNPGVIDYDYDEAKNTLKASSYDFLEIENAALGYKIKYLLKDFSLDNTAKALYYRGSVFFENMKGTALQQERWKKRREEVYIGSEMHFLRSALGDRIEEEGFRVQQLAIWANLERPADSVINTKISYYKALKTKTGIQRDSLAYWIKKSKLPKTFQKLMPYPLSKKDIIRKTNQPGQYAVGCEGDGLYVAYSKTNHFHIVDNREYLNKPINTETNLVNFNAPYAFFYSNGVIINPYSVMLEGFWGREGIAGLLPVDYDPQQALQVPVDSTIVRNIAAKLKTYSVNHIAEKAYLHFDKPYYAAGDTIYFKAYLTQGESHQPSAISGVLHVDLVNTGNKVDQSINLHVIDGVAWGDFALPDSLPKGNYRVRAYTRWMQNSGSESYFDQTIPVGSIRPAKTAESYVVSAKIENKPDVQFFPEGGRLVNGISSKIAFKAIGSNGLGIDIKGELTDNENRTVTSFASEHLGMGYFYLQPAEGKTYRAKITYPDGSQDIIALPGADPSGIVLKVNNDSKERLKITIAATESYYKENKSKDYALVIYSAGEVSSYICKLDSAVISLDVSKQTLHTGIAPVTLFSPTGEPLSERLIFVQNNDLLSVNVSSDKQVYNKRGKVNIKLNVKNSTGNASAGHFSVAVIDENKVPVDENAENTILTDLLLISGLKGYIEQPNYYFANTTGKTNADLDLVMLTHGYRSFEWEPLLKDEYQPVTQQPEKGLEISGIVKSPKGIPLDNGTVSLLSMHGGPVLSQDIDKNGSFHFNDLTFMDNSNFVLKAVNAKLKNNTRPVYNAVKPELVTANENAPAERGDVNKTMQAYLENKKLWQEETVKYGPLRGMILKEVKIEDYPSSSWVGPGFADQVIHRKDIAGSGLFSNQFSGRLIGVHFVTDPLGGSSFAVLDIPLRLGANPPMLVVLDGVEIPGGNMNLDEINVSDIETVEVLRNSDASIYGARGMGGVLIITLRRGGIEPISRETPDGLLPISPKGYYKAREFYAPKYDHTENAFNREDLRSTIYWKPELVTDKDGNASFNYYNADGTGSYRLVIEGIDENGNLGRQVYRYKVE